MASAVLLLATVSILFLWPVLTLRSYLPWRVNCWFCNCNIWVKYIKRNSWTCPKCEQYNGFTKDGDYNRALHTNTEEVFKSPKFIRRSLPKNGFCKMCNTNQQLKVAQLANFVPSNEKKFDKEIEIYRKQLERAYDLCTLCKMVVQKKLYIEKVSLLTSKLLESKASNKRDQRTQKKSEIIKKVVNSASKLIANMLMGLVMFECFRNAICNEKIIWYLVTGIFESIKNKAQFTFSSLAGQHIDIFKIDMELFTSFIGIIDQKTLGGVLCFMQIIGNFQNIFNNFLWCAFTLTALLQEYVDVDPLIMSLVKLIAVFLAYRRLNNKTVKYFFTRKTLKLKKMNNYATAPNELIDTSSDMDVDVSHSRVNSKCLLNISNSSNGNIHSLNNRCYAPGYDESLCTKPKPSFNKYRNIEIFDSDSDKSTSSDSSNASTHSLLNSRFSTPRYDSRWIKPNPSLNNQNMEVSESDLDESINSLRISLRKFMASTNVFSPTPSNSFPSPWNTKKPVATPYKPGYRTSWVAGGYWGERQMNFNSYR